MTDIEGRPGMLVVEVVVAFGRYDDVVEPETGKADGGKSVP